MALAVAIAKGKHWHVFTKDGKYFGSCYYQSSAHAGAQVIGGTARYLTNVPCKQTRKGWSV